MGRRGDSSDLQAHLVSVVSALRPSQGEPQLLEGQPLAQLLSAVLRVDSVVSS